MYFYVRKTCCELQRRTFFAGKPAVMTMMTVKHINEYGQYHTYINNDNNNVTDKILCHSLYSFW